MFTQIVVAVDQSDHAERAILAACNLARVYDASLHLVHAAHAAQDAVAVGADVYVAFPSDVDDAEDQAVMTAAAATAQAQGVMPASQRVGQGGAADLVIAVAAEVGADLIVVGRRGLGGFGSMMLGSTSLRISHLATCAVLTVK